MSGPADNPACEWMLSYLSETCSEAEKAAFERHLSTCSMCRAELDHLRLVWEVLPHDMERIEPPEDLKQQVLDAVFSFERETPLSPAAEPEPAKTRSLRKRRMSAVVAAAAVVLFAAGTLWNYSLFLQRSGAPLSGGETGEAVFANASQIESLLTLQPTFAETGNTYGIVCIIDDGHRRQLVVYVFGAVQTSGLEAYQVWLLNGDERTSAGTFRVNDRGIGVLVAPVGPDALAPDAVGITLEPDDRGTEPRGAKMYAST